MKIEPLHNEAALLRALSEGNDQAFSEIYHNYLDAIYGLGLVYLKVPALAEDAVQVVFLKIWEHRAELPALESFTAWLYIVTRNELLFILRKQSAETAFRRYIKERMEEGVPEAGEADAIQPQTFAIIKRAIAELPPQQQLAFTLQREGGLTYNEIAQQMGVAVNTVRKHLHLALTAIRDYVKRHNGDALTCILYAIQLFFS